MAYPKLARMVSEIHRRTSGGSMRWEETSTENTFQVALANYTLRISQITSNYEDDISYYFAITDEKGREIEGLSPGDFDQTELGKRPHVVLKEIYEGARRMALGVEKSLDDILSQLEQGGV